MRQCFTFCTDYENAKDSVQFQGGIGHAFGGISFFVWFRSFSCSDIVYKLVKVKSQSNTKVLLVEFSKFWAETYFMKQNKAAILKPMPGFLKYAPILIKRNGIRKESGHVRALSMIIQSGCSFRPTNSTVKACLWDLKDMRWSSTPSCGDLPETSEEKSWNELSNSELCKGGWNWYPGHASK